MSRTDVEQATLFDLPVAKRSVRSLASEARFRKRLAELGAILLERRWLGATIPHRIRCAQGHDVTAKPVDLPRQKFPCRVCARRDPATAAAAFWARVEELGGTVLEPKWLGALTKHHVRCPVGHDAYVKPAQVQQGGGICWECSPCYPGTAEPAFRARVAAQGGECLYNEWTGNNKRHHVRCGDGHDVYPYPSEVQQGGRICRVCSGKDPITAEAAFRVRVAELGGTCLYESWRGVNKPHHIRDAAGHDCYPTPGKVRDRNSLQCKTCSGKDPALTEARFRSRLAELGAVPLFTEWRNVFARYETRCSAGHLCYPQAHSVLTGGGACAICAGQVHTAFYVTENQSEHVIKFGITGHDGQKRLEKHRADGFTVVHLLVTGLADGIARETENAVKATLALAEATPVRGLEYFDASHLALILDVATSWAVPVAA